MAKEDLLEGLLLQAIESIGELNKTTAVQSSRLDQYNQSLSEHMKQTKAVQVIAEAAMTEAKAAFELAKKPCDAVNRIQMESANISTYLQVAKPTITIAHRVITWAKVSFKIVVYATPFVAAGWAIFKYYHKIG